MESVSEFITPGGNIVTAKGETKVAVDGGKTQNKSFAVLNGSKIENFYSITKIV